VVELKVALPAVVGLFRVPMSWWPTKVPTGLSVLVKKASPLAVRVLFLLKPLEKSMVRPPASGQ
jgi:hypothetical protein